MQSHKQMASLLRFFTSTPAKQNREMALATQALKQFFASLNQDNIDLSTVRTAILVLAILYRFDPTLHALVPQTKRQIHLLHSLYETGATLGSPLAQDQLQVFRSGPHANTIFDNLYMRSTDRSFTEFLEFLHRPMNAKNPMIADLLTEIQPVYKNLREKMSKTETLNTVAYLIDFKNHPAYRFWLAFQVDKDTEKTEHRKLNNLGPAAYLKDFLENHIAEITTAYAENGLAQKITAQLLFKLGHLTANNSLAIKGDVDEKQLAFILMNAAAKISSSAAVDAREKPRPKTP